MLASVVRAVALSSVPLLLTGCASGGTSVATSTPAASSEVTPLVDVVKETLPFNPASFTQGLEVTPDGEVIVGTGQYGESRVYRFDPATNKETASSAVLPHEMFGEGITQVGDAVWQLTWQSGVAIRYDAVTLREIGRASYAGEGWGLCNLGDKLALSDGTPRLRFVHPDTFAEVGSVEVTRDGQPVKELNEIECVDGQIYGNVWMSPEILRIDPATGHVTGVVDATAAVNNAQPDPDNVLNGIAHIPGTDEFFITGKRWPDMYRVTFEEK